MILVDSSSLIALTQINAAWLLPTLFTDVLIPPPVEHETAQSVPRSSWLTTRPLAAPLDPRIVAAGLGPHESEVLSLALELGQAMVILDERAARRLADELGIPVTGTLGILLEARRRGLIAALKPYLDALIADRFFLARELINGLVAQVGEAERR